jgi:hypothetical protein
MDDSVPVPIFPFGDAPARHSVNLITKITSIKYVRLFVRSKISLYVYYKGIKISFVFLRIQSSLLRRRQCNCTGHSRIFVLHLCAFYTCRIVQQF